jgi:3-mercaptopropionate dioxygenase
VTDDLVTTTTVRQPSGLAALSAAVRRAVGTGADWQGTAGLVADQLRAHLPDPEVLPPAHRLGDPDRLRSHILHVEPDGGFSVVALVLRPGQATRIHDHVTWCAVGVVLGVEHEELFNDRLQLVGENDNRLGEVSGLAPPGDIHRVGNRGATTAISIHVYGTDVTRIGSSVRRYYD